MTFRLFLLSVLSCFTFSVYARNTLTYSQEMRLKVSRYRHSARLQLEQYFRRAHVAYPPKKLAFLIFKHSAKFEMYAKGAQNKWRYIKTFPILATSGGLGPKLRSGDYQVPEGVYKIVGYNPWSRFDLSLHLNYPNRFDRQHGKQDRRRYLGNNIFIHGKKRSIGCVALGDKVIEQLFPLVYIVGAQNVKVIIAPNDFRYAKALPTKVHPKWLPELYGKIKYALKAFPLPIV